MPSPWTITIDGTDYPIPIGGTPRLSVLDLKWGIFTHRNLVFDEILQHDLATWGKGDVVRLLHGTDPTWTPMFWGRIHKPRHIGQPGKERVRYECHGPLSLLNKVSWLRNGSARVCFNLTDVDDEDYLSSQTEIGIKTMLTEMVVDMATEIVSTTGLSGVSIDAALPDDIQPENTCFNAPTGLLDIIDQLLRWVPSAIRWVEPTLTGGILHIDMAASLAPKTITIGGGNLIAQNQVEPTSSNSYGALEIYGKREQTDRLWFYDPEDLPGSTLQPDWDPTAGDLWTPETRNDSEELKKVHRQFKEKTDQGMWARSNVRAVPNATIAAWARHELIIGGGPPQYIWYQRALDEYNVGERSFRLRTPTWKEFGAGYLTGRVYLRNVTLGSAVSVRNPVAGFAGDAFTIDGVEHVWKKYSEKLVKSTFIGTTTEEGLDGQVIDEFAALRNFYLIGNTINISGFGNFTITMMQRSIVDTDSASTIPAGTAYTILALDNTSNFEDILASLFDTLTAVEFPIRDVINNATSQVTDYNAPLLLSIAAADAHPTGWESLDVVMTDATLDMSDDTLSVMGDSIGSINAKAYEDLIAETDIETRIEELEIWTIRNEASEEDNTGHDAETTVDLSTGDLTDHNHEEAGDGGVIDLEKIMFTDGTNTGPFLDAAQGGIQWNSVEEGWEFQPADHEHILSAGDGGPLDIDFTNFSGPEGTGPLSGTSWTGSAWTVRPSDHEHAAAGDGGLLHVVNTEFTDGVRVGPLDLVWDGSKWESPGVLPDHQHNSIGDGGPLDANATIWEDGTNTGGLIITWDSGNFHAGWSDPPPP